MKLKTLNDIKEKWGSHPNKQVEIIFKELKQEAIKWVKDWRNPEGENYGKSVDWVLMKLNNITEEDLIQSEGRKE